MSGLKATFTLPKIKTYIKQQKSVYESAVLNTLIYAGEGFVRDARIKTAEEGGFKDYTGNLRSSIGYIILQNGKQISDNFEPSSLGSDKETGLLQGMVFAQEIGLNYPKGFALICVAGMSYAAHVENVNLHDVITGSSLIMEQKLKTLLSQI